MHVIDDLFGIDDVFFVDLGDASDEVKFRQISGLFFFFLFGESFP